MLAIHSKLKQFIIWVQVVQNCISVCLARCSENADLHMFIRFDQALHHEGPYVDASADRLFIRKIYFKDDIRVLGFYVVNAVDQSFVHIKNQNFLVSCFRQSYEFIFVEVRVPYFLHNISDEIHSRDCVLIMNLL